MDRMLNAVVLFGMMIVAGAAAAQAFPSKPVRVIVPFFPISLTNVPWQIDRLAKEPGSSIQLKQRKPGGP